MTILRFLVIGVFATALTISVSGQARHSTTVQGTIEESIALLEKHKDRLFIRDYLVTKVTTRIRDAEATKSVKSFRDFNCETLRCEGLSSAESLLKALKAAKSIKPTFPTKQELERYNFRKTDQELAWALIKFDSPVCSGGSIAIWFVKIDGFWYIRG